MLTPKLRTKTHIPNAEILSVVPRSVRELHAKFADDSYKEDKAGFALEIYNAYFTFISGYQGVRRQGINMSLLDGLLTLSNKGHKISPLGNLMIQDVVNLLITGKPFYPANYLIGNYDASRTVVIKLPPEVRRTASTLDTELFAMYNVGGFATAVNVLVLLSGYLAG